MFTNIDLRENQIVTDSGLKLSYVAYLELVKGERQPSVTHNITEIMAVVKGSGEFYADGASYSVKPGSVFVVNADTLHAESCTGENFGVYIVGVENYSLSGGIESPVQSEVIRIPYFCEQIIFESEKKGEHFKENATMLFSLIINDVLDIAKKRLIVSGKRGSNEVVNMVKKYLDGHFLEDISVDMLAKKFFVNKNTLMHNFKAQTGVSVIDYVIKKRLTESVNWLKISSLSIKQVADRCAFSNPSYFTKYFKSHYGVTPTEYRKNI